MKTWSNLIAWSWRIFRKESGESNTRKSLYKLPKLGSLEVITHLQGTFTKIKQKTGSDISNANKPEQTCCFWERLEWLDESYHIKGVSLLLLLHSEEGLFIWFSTWIVPNTFTSVNKAPVAIGPLQYFGTNTCQVTVNVNFDIILRNTITFYVHTKDSGVFLLQLYQFRWLT